MPDILDSIKLPSGHELLVVSASSDSRRCHYGVWGIPMRLALVETDGTPYRHGRGRNVIRTIAVHYADGRNQGARSDFGAKERALRQLMHEEAASYLTTTSPEDSSCAMRN